MSLLVYKGRHVRSVWTKCTHHRWTRGVVEGGHPPVVAEISTPPLELKYTPPLWDGLNTPLLFLSLGKFF